MENIWFDPLFELQPDWQLSSGEVLWATYRPLTSSRSKDQIDTDSDEISFQITLNDTKQDENDGDTCVYSTTVSPDKYQTTFQGDPKPASNSITSHQLNLIHIPTAQSTRFIAPWGALWLQRAILALDVSDTGTVAIGGSGGFACITSAAVLRNHARAQVLNPYLKHDDSGICTIRESQDLVHNASVAMEPSDAIPELPFPHVSLVGHVLDVNAIQFLVSGRAVVTGSSDMSLRIWDTRSGHCGAVLRGHQSGILSLTPVGIGKHIYSSSRDGSISVWQTSSAASIGKARLKSSINSIITLYEQGTHIGWQSCTPEPIVEDSLIVAACEDGTLQLCRISKTDYTIMCSAQLANTGIEVLCPIKNCEHAERCFGLAISSDGEVKAFRITQDYSSDPPTVILTKLNGALAFRTGRPTSIQAKFMSSDFLSARVTIGLSTGETIVAQIQFSEDNMSVTSFKHHYVLSGATSEPIRGLASICDQHHNVHYYTGSNDGVLRLYTTSL